MFGHINDNRGARPRHQPDAHGHAALLLAESTLHVLIENGSMTTLQALAAVQSAASVKAEIANDDDKSAKQEDESRILLSRIAASLKSDLV